MIPYLHLRQRALAAADAGRWEESAALWDQCAEAAEAPAWAARYRRMAAQIREQGLEWRGLL